MLFEPDFHKMKKQRLTTLCLLCCVLGLSASNSCMFLIRSSSASVGEFVLSFLFSGRCEHYYITCTNDYKYCFENGPHFAGMV